MLKKKEPHVAKMGGGGAIIRQNKNGKPEQMSVRGRDSSKAGATER